MYVSYDTLSVFWAVQPGLILCDTWYLEKGVTTPFGVAS